MAPFYRYGGHIELIPSEEYYRILRGHEHISGVVNHVTWYWISPFKFFFFQVSLPYHLLFLEDVVNNGFWKICLKITNDLEQAIIYLSNKNSFKISKTTILLVHHISLYINFFSVNVGLRRENANVYF